MNDKRANKSCSIDAPRGLWSSQSWREKPRTLKPTQCQSMHRTLFGWNQTLHLPTVEREVFLWKWKSCQLSAAEMLYLQTASPAEEGIWSALLVPPSIWPRSSPNPSAPCLVAGVHRAGVLRVLHLIYSFSLYHLLQNTKSAPQNMSDGSALMEMSIFYV